jgi:uncharacterized membrane protein YdbT with pleckstrin-like domain
MGFPRRLLSEGEELVLDLRPHWIALVWPVALIVLVAGAVTAILVTLPHSCPSAVRWIAFLAGVLAVLILAVPRIVLWLTSHFVVTTDRVVHRSGWFAKRSMEIPLENISDVSFHQSVFERVIGAGDLILESPGTFGQETFSDIRNPEFVQKTIYEMNEDNRRRMAAPVAGAAPSVADELAKLDDLRRRGVLSQDEFAAQKARLLGGPGG